MMRILFLSFLLIFMSGCGDDAVNSEEEARAAYMGLDQMIGKAMDLGFKGFNAAQSANIAPQTMSGDASGMLTISGKVDQGSSANKGMRLIITLEGYADDQEQKITYDTDIAGPTLDLNLKSIPTGTLSGSLQGLFLMSGRLMGEVTLSITMAGQLQPDPANSAKVQRVPGSTHITGSAQSPFGTYSVDITR